MMASRQKPPVAKRAPYAAPLKVDPEKYPNLKVNPSLERALRIRQELEKGRPREEAIALADEAMGRIGKPREAPPKAGGRPHKASPDRKPSAVTPAKRKL